MNLCMRVRAPRHNPRWHTPDARSPYHHGTSFSPHGRKRARRSRASHRTHLECQWPALTTLEWREPLGWGLLFAPPCEAALQGTGGAVFRNARKTGSRKFTRTWSQKPNAADERRSTRARQIIKRFRLRYYMSVSRGCTLLFYFGTTCSWKRGDNWKTEHSVHSMDFGVGRLRKNMTQFQQNVCNIPAPPSTHFCRVP